MDAASGEGARAGWTSAGRGPIFLRGLGGRRREEATMKKVIVLVVIAVAGAFAYQHFMDGNFGTSSLTPEERLVQSFDERIDNAVQQIAQASRAAGVSGMDTTSDVEPALRELERVETEIQSLRKKASSDETRRECDRLLQKVEAARR